MLKNIKRLTSKLALLSALSVCVGSALAKPLIPAASSADGTVKIGQETVHYQAHWMPLALKDDEGAVLASISATSYIKDASTPENRPVIFLFSGGPGASSSPLHNTLGPQAADEFDVHLFSDADLVFIDPVGTGFSRNFSDSTPYWSREGDADAALQYIRHWRSEFNRGQSPFYVGGASYGGFRLAMMLPELAEMGISGGIFISPALDFSGNAETASNNHPFIHRVPTMAVAAWHHGVANQDLDNPQAVFARAREFSDSAYMHALYQGTRLEDEDATPVVTRMAELTGLSEALIRSHRLRVPTQVFLENLLDDDLLGRLDTRVTQPKKQPAANSDRPDAANDPSLGLGRSNKLVSDSLREYFVGQLGVQTELEYYSLNLDLNFAWEWRAAQNTPDFVVNPLDKVIEVMNDDTDFKVFVVGGYFDLTTPVAAVEYTFTRPGLDSSRVFFNFIPGAHSPFNSEEHRDELIRQLHQFIAR